MLNKRIKFLGLFILIIGLAVTMSACDMGGDPIEEVDDEIYIEKIDLPDNIEVLHGTEEGEVIEDYLPEETEVILDSGKSKRVELAWDSPNNFDSEKCGEYVFEGSFNIDEEVQKITVYIQLMDQKLSEGLEIRAEEFQYSQEQLKKLFQGKGKITFTEEQIDLIEEPVNQFLNSNLSQKVDTEEIENLIDGKMADLDGLDKIAEELLEIDEANNRNRTEIVTDLQKLPKNNSERNNDFAELSDNTEIVYTPKAVTAGDKDFEDDAYTHTDINRWGAMEIPKTEEMEKYNLESPPTLDDMVDPIADSKTGAVANFTYAIFGRHIENSMQEIIFYLAEDDTDITIEVDITYNSFTYDGLGAFTTTRITADPPPDYRPEDKVIESIIDFSDVITAPLSLAADIAGVPEVDSIPEAFEILNTVITFKSYLESLEGLANTESETIKYQADSLNAGSYTFRVGMESRSSASLIKKPALAVVLGQIKEIRVEKFHDSQIIEFEDENLEEAVREEINKPEGTLYVSDVINITKLNASDRGIESIEGIQYLENLETLLLYDNGVKDIGPLENLTNLKGLNFKNNKVDDITPLVKNEGLGEGDLINMQRNHLDLTEGSKDMENINTLIERGVDVYYKIEVILIIKTEGKGSTDPYAGPYPYNRYLYDEGEKETLEADPDDGWVFSHWEGEVDDLYSAETTITMDDDKEVTAYFEEEDEPEEYYILDVIEGKGGSVTIDPDQEEYQDGTEVELEADSDDGWEFCHWEGEVDDSDNAETTIIIDNDKTVTAHFVEEDEPVEDKFPFFEVEIIDHPAAVDIGDEMTVEVEVTNSGDESGEAYIDLFIDNTDSYVDDKDVSLAPGESETVELNYITQEGDGEEIEVIVKPLNRTTDEYDSHDRVWVNLEVTEKTPYFEVEITDYPEEAVYYGEELTVRGKVKNTAGAGSQDILFGFGEHHAEAKEDIELDSGESREVSFNHEPIEDDVGYNTIALVSVDSEIIDQDVLENQIEVIGLLFTDLEPENDPIYVTEPYYQAKLYCSGSNFENVQAIVYQWEGAVSGNSYWTKGDKHWNAAVTIKSDTKMILEPIVVGSEPSWTGTLYYTVTLIDDRNQTASQTFEVTYEP